MADSGGDESLLELAIRETSLMDHMVAVGGDGANSGGAGELAQLLVTPPPTPLLTPVSECSSPLSTSGVGLGGSDDPLYYAADYCDTAIDELFDCGELDLPTDDLDLELCSRRVAVDSPLLSAHSLDMMWNGTSCPAECATVLTDADSTHVSSSASDIAKCKQEAKPSAEAKQRTPLVKTRPSCQLRAVVTDNKSKHQKKLRRPHDHPPVTMHGKTRIISIPSVPTTNASASSSPTSAAASKKPRLTHYVICSPVRQLTERCADADSGSAAISVKRSHAQVGRRSVVASVVASGGATTPQVVTRRVIGRASTSSTPVLLSAKPGAEKVSRGTQTDSDVQRVSDLLRNTSSTLVRLLLTGQDFHNGYRLCANGQCITPSRSNSTTASSPAETATATKATLSCAASSADDVIDKEVKEDAAALCTETSEDSLQQLLAQMSPVSADQLLLDDCCYQLPVTPSPMSSARMLWDDDVTVTSPTVIG